MIKGEKVFTARARQRCIDECLRNAAKAERDAKKEAARQRALAEALRRAKTTADLEKIRLSTHINDVELREYCFETKRNCTYCKRRDYGGHSYESLTGVEIYCCWRTACGKRDVIAVRKDRKTHPKLYQAELKRARIARARWQKNERRYMRRDRRSKR